MYTLSTHLQKYYSSKCVNCCEIALYESSPLGASSLLYPAGRQNPLTQRRCADDFSDGDAETDGDNDNVVTSTSSNNFSTFAMSRKRVWPGSLYRATFSSFSSRY